MFAPPEARRGRYYLTDSFLRSWLAALANPVAAGAFRPLDGLLDEADRRLADAEGAGLQKLVGQVYEERSRKGLPEFPLSHRIQGYWDKADTEIDLVAVNEESRSIRFGSCKRSAKKLLADVNNFKRHVQRFLEAMPYYQSWMKQYVAVSTTLTPDQRIVLARHDVIAEDLNDLTSGLT